MRMRGWPSNSIQDNKDNNIVSDITSLFLHNQYYVKFDMCI